MSSPLQYMASRIVAGVAGFVVGLAVWFPVTARAQTYPAAYVTNLSSLWNKPVKSAATFSAIPTYLGGLDSWEGVGWSIPFYVANLSDPVAPATLQPLLYNSLSWSNVYSGRWKRYGNTPDMEQEILATSSNYFPWPGNPYSSISTTAWVLPPSYHANLIKTSGPPSYWYYSASMLPASASDGHMAVLQPNGMVIETYATIVLSNGTVVATSWDLSNPSGLVNGWQDGQTASMVPVYAGQLDDQEFLAGKITHAMAITVPASLLAPAVADPAYAFDRAAMRQSPPYSGHLPMGARLALPPSLSLDSLNLQTKEGRIIAAAAQTYGFIIVDQGGGGIAIRVTANPSVPDPAIRAYNWPLQSDLNAIMKRVQQVR